MWIFTKAADWFDKTRAGNEAWIDQTLQPWVGTTLYEHSPWYRNVGIWTAAGTLYAVNKFTTTVAAGFVDVLRVGDGVQEGGWGYGKDALRLLMILGPAARAARYGASLVASVDVSGGAVGNCAWVAAARLLRLTGAKPLAQLGDVAKWAGITAEETGGIKTVAELAPPLQHLGADARIVSLSSQGVKVEEALTNAVAANPNGGVMFSIRWQMGTKTVGHALLASRNVFGRLIIIDRLGGMPVKSLAQLERFYPGISAASLDTTAVVVQNSVLVRTLGTVPTLAEIIRQAVPSSQPVSTPDAGSSSPAKAAPAPPPNSPAKANPVPQQQAAQGVLRRYEFCPPPTEVSLHPACTFYYTYIVASGDNLSSISIRVYRDGSKWPIIYQANRDALGPDPHSVHALKVGMELVIPTARARPN